MTTEPEKPSSIIRQADAQYPYGYGVLRLIFGKAAAEDFLRISYSDWRSGVAKNEVIQSRSGNVDVV